MREDDYAPEGGSREPAVCHDESGIFPIALPRPQVRVLHREWRRPSGLEVRRALRRYEQEGLGGRMSRAFYGRFCMFYLYAGEGDEADDEHNHPGGLEWFPLPHEMCLARQRRDMRSLRVPPIEAQERVRGSRWWPLCMDSGRLWRGPHRYRRAGARKQQMLLAC